MRLDAHRSDPRPAAAVRDAEGLVQVEVRHVAAEPARPAEADHRVHVGAVDVHLSAVAVDDVADLAHRFLEHAVRRRIGDHRCGEARSMLPGLAPEIREIDVAVLVAFHHDDLHAGHLRARRVRAVRRARDQAHVAFALAAARVIGADREQPGVLALRARVRLQRDGVVAGACGQHLRSSSPSSSRVAFDLLRRGERVDPAELGPRDGNHLRRRIELHRAGAERDHRAVEREILVRERAQVAQHLGLGAMAVEHGVGEERARRTSAAGMRSGAAASTSAKAGTAARSPAKISQSRRTSSAVVVSSSEMPTVPASTCAQVDAAPLRFTMDRAGPAPARDGDRVEEGLRRHRVTQTPQPLGKRRREAMHALGDGLQPHRSVVDGVCRGHDRKQHLRRADVARRLLAPDVLLPRLQREPVSRFPLAVERHADQAARDHALVLIAGGEIGGVRAAEPERHAEALRRADRDVGAELARRR